MPPLSMLASSNVLRLESYIYYIYAYTSPPPSTIKQTFMIGWQLNLIISSPNDLNCLSIPELINKDHNPPPSLPEISRNLRTRGILWTGNIKRVTKNDNGKSFVAEKKIAYFMKLFYEFIE